MIDLAGKIFSELTVVRYMGNVKWLCQCSCGKEVIVLGSNLRYGRTKSCGCLKKTPRKTPPKNFVDITGREFGELVAKEYLGEGKWLCVCSCGNAKAILKSSLMRGSSRSCGCARRGARKRSGKYDLTGQTFGRLTVKAYFGEGKWECVCSCGNEKVVATKNLNTGATRSCGCLRREVSSANILPCFVDKTNPSLLNSTSLYSNNTTGVRGVHFVKASNRYRAMISFKGKAYHLGTSSSFEECVALRKEAEEKLFGDFWSEWKKDHS